MIITKFIRGLYSIYSKRIVKEELAKLAIPRAANEVELEYPFILCHNELISIGKGTTILANSRIQLYPEKTDKSPHLSIGDNCMFGYRLCILGGGDISIGNNVLIASDVTITSENHGYNPEKSLPYSKQNLVCKPINIGDNCWIGDKVTILPGVCIGQGCVIGAGSVVTKNIDPFSVAVGNPARIIKQYDFNLHKWVGTCVDTWKE